MISSLKANSRILLYCFLLIIILALGILVKEPEGYYGVIKIWLIFFASFIGVVFLRGRARDTSLVLSAIMLPLSIIAVYSSVFSKAPRTLHENSSWTINEFGYGPSRPGVEKETKISHAGEKIYEAAYTIDENLLRKVSFASSGETIPFFGCSFTFGVGLDDKDTLPQIFSDITNRQYHILNLGVPGGGPQQMLRALETNRYENLLKDKPKFFVFETSPFHIARAACKSHTSWFGPSYSLANGDVRFNGTCSSSAGFFGNLKSLISHKSFLRSFLAKEEPANVADVDLYIGMIKKSAQIIKEKYDVPLVLLFIPDDLASPSYNFSDKIKGNDDIVRLLTNSPINLLKEDEIVDMRKESNILLVWGRFDPVFSKTNFNELVIKDDGHPTRLSNDAWANRIKKYTINNDLGVK